MLTKTNFKLSLCFKYRLFAHFMNICAFIRIFMHILDSIRHHFSYKIGKMIISIFLFFSLFRLFFIFAPD